MRIVRFTVDVSGIRQLRQRHPVFPPTLPQVTDAPQAPVAGPAGEGDGRTVRTTPPHVEELTR